MGNPGSEEVRERGTEGRGEGGGGGGGGGRGAWTEEERLEQRQELTSLEHTPQARSRPLATVRAAIRSHSTCSTAAAAGAGWRRSWLRYCAWGGVCDERRRSAGPESGAREQLYAADHRVFAAGALAPWIDRVVFDSKFCLPPPGLI